MRFEFTTALMIAGLCLPVASVAQTAGGVVTARRSEAVTTPQAERNVRFIAGALEMKIVTGRPYSAEVVTESLHVLGDGNRIARRSTTKVYRDGEGRTRRETIGEDGVVQTISISDPVAHTNYTLDPKTKVAYKTGGTIVSPVMPSIITTSGRRGGGGARSGGTASVSGEQARPTTVSGGGRGGAARGTMMPRTVQGEDANVKKEDLGTQNIEGVMATGTRTTTIIPAGRIGNALDIRIVSEQWFADELQALVMTKYSDPRSGETTYGLRNILRAEPDQTLFTVPSDYTVQQRGVRRPQ